MRHHSSPSGRCFKQRLFGRRVQPPISTFVCVGKTTARLGLVLPTTGAISRSVLLSLLAIVSYSQANPFEKPNQGHAIQLESVLNQTDTMNQCADVDASVMLDIDCSGQAKALTDGLLVLRYLFGFRDEALTAQAVEGNRTSPADIEAYLESLEPELDLDGDGVVQPLTDGLILMRSLFGFSGEALISGATALNAPNQTAEAIAVELARLGLRVSLEPAPDQTLSWTLASRDAASMGLRQEVVDDVLDLIRSDLAVQAAVIVKNGYTIGSFYAPGFDESSPATSWSVAKSFYAALVGIAIDEGAIASLDQKASEFLTEWQGTDKAEITIRQILLMQSGYPGDDEVFVADDQTTYAIQHPLRREPGTRFVYSNANSQLMEPILRRATNLAPHDYLRQKLLDPIGINVNQVGYWRDADPGHALTYCCLDMRPVDFARFGLLFARSGTWNGESIISPSFIEQSTMGSFYYGLQWWLINESRFGEPPPWTGFQALGLDGQHIIVWPEADVVVVVVTQYQADSETDYAFDVNTFPPSAPDTCSARNSCPWSTGFRVPSFELLDLVKRMAPLE